MFVRVSLLPAVVASMAALRRRHPPPPLRNMNRLTLHYFLSIFDSFRSSRRVISSTGTLSRLLWAPGSLTVARAP